MAVYIYQRMTNPTAKHFAFLCRVDAGAPPAYAQEPKLKIETLRCRCGHTWEGRRKDVKACPRCKSRWWNKKSPTK